MSLPPKDSKFLFQYTLEEIQENEDKNFRANKQLLAGELPFFEELRWLCDNCTGEVGDSLYVPFSLYQIVGNSLTAAGLSLMRGHIMHSVGITRTAIEAAAFAYKTRDPEIARVWIRRKSGDEEHRKRLQKAKFPKSHPNLSLLSDRWAFACDLGSHATLASIAIKHVRDGDRRAVSFFDLADPPEPEFMRFFVWLLDTHLIIHGVFEEIFREISNVNWRERADKLRAGFAAYKRGPIRDMLDPQPGRKQASRTPGGIWLPVEGEFFKLVNLRAGRWRRRVT